MNAKPKWWEENATNARRAFGDLDQLDVNLATASLLDLGQISVTPSLVNVLVRHWHTEEDAASANLGTMAFPTVSRASVMDTPSLVTRSLESVSAARIPRQGPTATGAPMVITATLALAQRASLVAHACAPEDSILLSSLPILAP